MRYYVSHEQCSEQSSGGEKLMNSDRLAYIGRLSANLAHELNNPLGGAIRYLQLLLDQMQEDDYRRVYAEQAHDGLMRMANMIKRMLDFTRESTPMFDLIDIPQSIGRVLSSLSDEISAQNIKVETRFGKDIPVILNADVEQIFMNITKNAVQAMPNGGTLSIHIDMSSRQILEARFSDTGIGIPDGMQEKIFEPFFTTKNVGQGVGLGLPICLNIAQSYNGSIKVESKSGKGTTFVVRLPISDNGLTISRPEI